MFSVCSDPPSAPSGSQLINTQNPPYMIGANVSYLCNDAQQSTATINTCIANPSSTTGNWKFPTTQSLPQCGSFGTYFNTQ